MALPVILVDSATGSDTQASGAGPATALFGTTDASTDGAGTTVTLTAGTDLSGVATDGSHVIFLNDTTAGARNFGKITGTAGSGGATPTVTVANAFGLSLTTKSWAIGGKRASTGGTTSKKLFDNNSSFGDAMPGWIVEMKSGHTETIAATFAFRRSGDTTSGPIILRGEVGAATLPIVTFSNNGDAFNLRADILVISGFEMRNSNATKTASVAISIENSGRGSHKIIGMKINHATDKFWRGIQVAGASYYIGNTLANLVSHALYSAGNASVFHAISNYIHTIGGTGILISNQINVIAYQNIIRSCSGGGVSENTQSSSTRSTYIQNTIDNCTGDGMLFNSNGTPLMLSNVISNNSGYGVKFTSITIEKIEAQVNLKSNNAFYNNTSGATDISAAFVDSQTTDPAFTNAAAGDLSIGTNLKAKGYPLAGTLYVGTYSATYSYVDPGAAQRQEAASGGGAATIINGGLVQ